MTAVVQYTKERIQLAIIFYQNNYNALKNNCLQHRDIVQLEIKTAITV